jgi:gliding motility-associated-like protein
MKIIGLKIFLIQFFLLFYPVLFSVQGGNYTWIGGTGNWSDTLHWYSESGGLPSPADNVIFNNSSFTEEFQIVTIDVPAACHEMNWSNAVFQAILAGNFPLEIQGSLTLSQYLIIQYTGSITFATSLPNQFIQSAGIAFNSDMIFEGTGSWELLNQLDVGQRNIFFNRGKLITNSYTINCGSFHSISSSNRTLTLGSSNLNVVGFNGVWNVNSQLVVGAVNAIIQFSNPGLFSNNTFNGGNLVYGNVVFENDAAINGSNTFQNLFFNAEHHYVLASDETQTITGELFARGCSGMIDMYASGGSQATVAKNNGNITVSFVRLRSIKADISGSYQFNAYRSIDEGNNQDVNIYEDSRDMYWINGTGFWSDTVHWTSSPVNEDADCIPVIYDNIFFNDDSFTGSDSVKVDIQEITCNNITWSGNSDPVFINTQPGSKMNVYGSLQFSPNMTNEFLGPVLFSDTLNGRMIKTSNKGFNTDIVFNGENGGWTIFDSLKVDGIITFFNGSLNTNSSYVRSSAFKSDSAFNRTLTLGSSEFVITQTISPNSWSLNNENLDFTGGSSFIKMESANSSFYNFGGDTIHFYDILFSSIVGTAKLNTSPDTYVEFRKVDFKSNGTIQGSNKFDTLSFSPGNYYELASGSTQTILNEIYPTGNCDGPILLKSILNGGQANILKLNDTISIENTAIRDINAIGGAVFIAERSVDLGHNNGWDTISVSAPGKLFWVGGAGNWNDQSHWSLTSGGVGGECIPTPYDTVIFDQHSFASLDEFTEINLNNAFAHNLDWTNAGFVPEFKSANSIAYLRIYGSLKMIPEMKFTFPGYISFESSNKGETIVTANNQFHNLNNNVYFDGIGGEWTLLDSLQLGLSVVNKNNIYYYYGDLKTNSQYIDCYGFYSPYQSERNFSPDHSDLHICYEWYVDGTHLNLHENTSLIKIDSGSFIHRNGSYFPYNKVYFDAVTNPQSLMTDNADSVLFSEVIFNSSDGKMFGNLGSIYSHFTQFNGLGQVNQTVNPNVNVYVFDTLLFKSTGTLLGNDTVRNYVEFDSIGNVSGSGHYRNAVFKNDGNITGNNVFDSLTFNPPYTYQLGSLDKQTITDHFDIAGNNCEFIKLKATANEQAEVYKESGSVYGDFIEMTKISATGEALFDAGQFSVDVGNSNLGWLFHATPMNYSLGADTSILEGETINICANNFGGNSSTVYEWRDCTTGNVISSDSCLLVTERGYYCLTVYYDEGPGCTKEDMIFVGCYLDLLIDTTQVSCFGFDDGSVEIDIEIGVGPFNINWYNNGSIIGNNQDIYNLYAGSYYYTIEDSDGCISGDSIKITEPELMELNYTTHDACFEEENGKITLEVTGGTQPYVYYWSNDSIDFEISGIPTGSYNVTVTDDHSCPELYETFLISEWPELKFELESSDLVCFQDGTGEIEIMNITGGTGNYSEYNWLKDGAFFSDSSKVENLMAGKYTLTIFDDYGCNAEDSIVLLEPEPILLELTGTNGMTELGSIDLTATGGTPPYSFYWNTGAITEDIDPLGGGLYYVDVYDGNYCKASDSIFIDVHYRIYAPTAFSPNNDDFNNEFELFGLGTDLKEFELEIFNRYGQKVFETSDPEIHWNGKFNNAGQDLPIEVYTWIAELTYLGGEKVIDKGNVSLLR